MQLVGSSRLVLLNITCCHGLIRCGILKHSPNAKKLAFQNSKQWLRPVDYIGIDIFDQQKLSKYFNYENVLNSRQTYKNIRTGSIGKNVEIFSHSESCFTSFKKYLVKIHIPRNSSDSNDLKSMSIELKNSKFKTKILDEILISIPKDSLRILHHHLYN